MADAQQQGAQQPRLHAGWRAMTYFELALHGPVVDLFCRPRGKARPRGLFVVAVGLVALAGAVAMLWLPSLALPGGCC